MHTFYTYLSQHRADILASLASGLVASAFYQLGQYLLQKARSRATFFALEGTYLEFQKAKEGSQDLPTGGTVRLTYMAGGAGVQAKFRTEGIQKNGTQLWQGELSLSKAVYITGEGRYQHRQAGRYDDTGFHRVIYVDELHQFNVEGGNTSHPGGNADFRMVWRRS